jgi:hypothetical protein
VVDVLNWIHTLPLWCAKAGAFLLFGGVLVFVWRLPADFVFNGSPDRARWRDLRIWATVLTAIQFILYYIF